MTSPFFSLAQYEEYALDTETKGQAQNVFPVGCSIATPDGKQTYMRWGHEAGGNNCSLAEFVRWARVELSRKHQTCIMFNGPYDIRALDNIGVQVGAVVEDAGVVCALLNEHEQKYSLDHLGKKYTGLEKDDQALNQWCADRFGGKPTRDHQAQNYWRAPGNIVEPYAEQDAVMTGKLHAVRHPELAEQDLMEVYRLETMLIPVLHRMFKAGVRINVARAQLVQKEFQKEFDQLQKEWDKASGGIGFGERSRLIPFLLSLGIRLPRTKPTKMYPEGQYSVAKEVLEQIEHPVGGMIKRMRQLSHYKDTFIQSYLLDNVDDLGFIYPQFHQVRRSYGKDEETGTISGRFSSSGGLNAQNIPARDEVLAPLIRGLFIPISEDHVWLKLDHSQIEYRLFAHYAGGKMRRAYQENPYQDFHAWVMEITGLKRKQAKNVNFAKLYGAGLEKLALTIGCTLEEAREIVELYDAKIPEAKKMYYKAMNRGSVRGYVMTHLGRRCRFPSVGSTRKKYLKTHTALNKILQGSSADLIKTAMVEIDQHIDWDDVRMHLTVHDELDFSIPKGQEGVKVAYMLKEIMEDFDLTVPVKAEAEVGPSWGDTVSLEEYAKRYT